MLTASPVSPMALRGVAELRNWFRSTYSWRPKAIRTVSSPKAAADLLFATLYQTAANGELRFRIRLGRAPYLGTKVSYTDMLVVRDKLIADGSIVDVTPPGQVAWYVYALVETSELFSKVHTHVSREKR